MKRLLFMLAVHAAVPAHANQDAQLLDAIAQVENHRWSDAGGKYALSYSAWRDVSGLPYDCARNPAIGTAKAYEHLARLRKGLKSHGMAATPYALALCWRGGLARFVKGQSPESHKDYARRVVNLFHAD